MKYHEIAWRDVPAWYDLALADGNAGLRILVSCVVADEVVRILNTNLSIVHDLRANCGDGISIPEFIPPSGERPWGFGEVLSPAKRAGPDWVAWECSFPFVGEDRGLGERNSVHSWESIFALSATLKRLFQALIVPENGPDKGPSQLCAVTGMRCSTDMQGGAISVLLSEALVRWLSRLFEDEIPEIAAAMKDAHRRMWHTRDDGMFFRNEFGARRGHENALHLTVPGNACGLDPSPRYRTDPLKGYELLPHNTDSLIQQIALLAGVAKLCDMHRASLAQPA